MPANPIPSPSPNSSKSGHERVAHPYLRRQVEVRTGGPSSRNLIVKGQPMNGWPILTSAAKLGKDGWPILYSFIVKGGVSRVPRDRCCFVLMPRRQRTTHERAGCLLEPQVLRVDNERVAHPLRLHRKGWGIARPARPSLPCPQSQKGKRLQPLRYASAKLYIPRVYRGIRDIPNRAIPATAA
jgi:hypothetical protein